MELRHVRYFLAVAEERNFTRAAAKLGIAQPPLSSQIKDLEVEIGTALFRRVPHGAELTEAGHAFHSAVSALPEQFVQAVRIAQRAARGETGELALGFSGTAALNPLASSAIRAFRRAYPDVELRVEETNALNLLLRLTEGKLDVAILRPASSDPAEIREERLADEPLIAALPASHEAAQARSLIELSRLKDDAFILTPRSAAVSLHDATLAACRGCGFEPKRGQAAPQIATILSLVSAEMGVALVPASLREFGVHGVSFHALTPPVPSIGLAVAYRRENTPVLALNFARIARRVSKRAIEEA